MSTKNEASGDTELRAQSPPPSSPTTHTPVEQPSESSAGVLSHVPTPHQKTMQVNHLTFSSEFDSGNLKKVKYDDRSSEYHLYQARDAEDTVHEAPYTTWFHFSVKDAKPNQLVHFVIMNMNKQNRLYKQDYRPFYKVVPNDNVADPTLPAYNNWQRLPTPVNVKPTQGQNLMQMKFKFKFDPHFLKQFGQPMAQESGEGSVSNCNFTVYFAFCYPQSYTDSQRALLKIDASAASLASRDVYYHREVLTHSIDKRRIDMLTISNFEAKLEHRDETFDFTPAFKGELLCVWCL